MPKLETPINIQNLLQKLYRKAKQTSNFRFYALYDKVYRIDVLTHAYTLVKRNGSSPCIDRVTFVEIGTYGLMRGSWRSAFGGLSVFYSTFSP